MKRLLATFSVFALFAAIAVVGTSSSGAQVPPSVLPPTCAFPIIVNQDDANVAFPDTNSTYWAMPTDYSIGDVVTVSGQFPYARYMSLNSYTAAGASTGGLHDSLIIPDSGSVNPFTPGVEWTATPRNYTVPVNVTATPQITSPVAGQIDIGPGAGWLLIRVYVPDDAASAAGSVPLPSLTVNGTTLTGCTTFGMEPAIIALGALLTEGALADSLPPAEVPEFTFAGDSSGLFPNADNKYVYATTTWKPGRLILVRGAAPSSPDTPVQPLYPQQQLRYWSMCTNLLVVPAPVVDCARDSTTALDAQGRYTYVIGADQDRPSDASIARNGGTWLRWFGPIGEGLPDAEKPTGDLIMRNMLPDPSFDNAIQNIPVSGSNADARATMGAYYPDAVYCDRDVFERLGVDGCFAVRPRFTG